MALAKAVRDRLTLPAFAAPMFLCSGTDLAIAACEAGIIGSLTRNHCRDDAEMVEQLMTVSEAMKRFGDVHPGKVIGPLAMNISPNSSPEDFRAQLAACKQYGVRIIVTSVGDCRMNRAPPSSRSKPGTPAALHEERAVKANLPASTSSLSFFITSFAHCFRFGLPMSLMRWVGCCPVTPDSSFEM